MPIDFADKHVPLWRQRQPALITMTEGDGDEGGRWRVAGRTRRRRLATRSIALV